MLETSRGVTLAQREQAIARTDPPAPEDTRPRLDFIDGIRGLAALAVVLLHAFEAFGTGYDRAPAYAAYVAGPLGAGLERLYSLVVLRFAWAVEVFIVVSGFSLMLPLARAWGRRPELDVLTFMRRRARRILPPYYAAMALGLLLIIVVPGMGQPSGEGRYWDKALPALDAGVLASHLLLVHNWTNDWANKIDPPMWSIAVEWQIYLVFPLLILVARRWGAHAALLLGLGAGVAQGFGESVGLRAYPFSYPWYLGLFSLGMYAAWLSYGAEGAARRWRERLPWPAIGAAAFGLMFALKAFGLRSREGGEWLTDPLLGLAVAALLVHLATRPTSRLRDLLGARWAVRLGHCSYSLYLVHAPVLTAVALAVLGLGVEGPLARLAVILIGPIVALLVTYPFYLAFERPSTRPVGSPRRA